MGLWSLVAGIVGAVLFVLDARSIRGGPAFWPLMGLAALLLLAGVVLGLWAATHGQRALGSAGGAVSLLALAALLHPFFSRA